MFSSEIQKIANDVQRIANNMNGGSSGGGLVIPIYNIEQDAPTDDPTVTCNMTFSEIKEAIDAGQCICAVTNDGTIANMKSVTDMIVFSFMQLGPGAIIQYFIGHDSTDSITFESRVVNLIPGDSSGPK